MKDLPPHRLRLARMSRHWSRRYRHREICEQNFVQPQVSQTSNGRHAGQSPPYRLTLLSGGCGWWERAPARRGTPSWSHNDHHQKPLPAGGTTPCSGLMPYCFVSGRLVSVSGSTRDLAPSLQGRHTRKRNIRDMHRSLFLMVRVTSPLSLSGDHATALMCLKTLLRAGLFSTHTQTRELVWQAEESRPIPRTQPGGFIG
ncbi:hypothetical protein QBC39DRAFT_65953 [Podospora conica]|nr:hypothetical protein QBC39DRAFT_65953 [Schizothecium conicum]